VLPNLSIIIPSHNRADLLRACLETVTRHAPPATEVLVVDDASPRENVSQTARAFPGVQTLRLPRRCGFCAAVNAGIEAARGDILELLNDDTEVTVGWAEPALAHFADAAVAAVAPLVLCWPGSSRGPAVIDSAGDRYYWGGVAGKRGHRQPLGPAYLRPGPVFGASASSAFYRRAALRRAGGFPESFGAYFEDVDVSFRLHWAGYRVLYEPASQVCHHVSASYGRTQRRLLEQQSQNEERVFWRNVPREVLPWALPRHLAVLAGKAWRRWHEGGLVPFLCGRLRVLGEVKALRRHRRWLRRLGPDAASRDWQIEECLWS
jgi:GT2 family glycosyltransferase